MYKKFYNLAGKILISAPSTDPHSYFAKSVIYIAKHDHDGAIGLIVNQPVNNLPKNLYIKNSWDQDGEDLKFDHIQSYIGGPVDVEKGFILHSNDYTKNVLEKNKEIYLSSNIEVLKDIRKGTGPKESLFLFGYCGWDKGQLEEEIRENLWIICESDENTIFKVNNNEKWKQAINKLNIDPAFYSTAAGTC
ncbi:MAG: YqgE/AlgH family protein [Rickettsiales bacterium]